MSLFTNKRVVHQLRKSRRQTESDDISYNRRLHSLNSPEQLLQERDSGSHKWKLNQMHGQVVQSSRKYHSTNRSPVTLPDHDASITQTVHHLTEPSESTDLAISKSKEVISMIK